MSKSTTSAEDPTQTPDPTTNPTPEPQRCPDPVTETVEYWTKKGRIELATGLIGLKQLQFEQASAHENRRAEEQHIRKAVWDYEPAQEDDADMLGSGTTVLGDQVTNNITQPPPPPPPPPPPSPVKGIALAAAIATLTSAGIAGPVGYLISQMRQPETTAQPTRDIDSTYRIEKWTPPRPSSTGS